MKEVVKVLRLALVGACSLVAYRRAMELPYVEKGRDADGVMQLRPVTPDEAAEQAIEHGTVLADKLCAMAERVWRG